MRYPQGFSWVSELNKLEKMKQTMVMKVNAGHLEMDKIRIAANVIRKGGKNL